MELDELCQGIYPFMFDRILCRKCNLSAFWVSFLVLFSVFFLFVVNSLALIIISIITEITIITYLSFWTPFCNFHLILNDDLTVCVQCWRLFDPVSWLWLCPSLALFWHRRWPFQDRDFLYDEDGRRIARPQALGEAEWMPPTPRSKAPRRLPPLMSPRNQELVQHRNRIMPIGGSSSLDPYWGAAGSNWRAIGAEVWLTRGEREVEGRERKRWQLLTVACMVMGESPYSGHDHAESLDPVIILQQLRFQGTVYPVIIILDLEARIKYKVVTLIKPLLSNASALNAIEHTVHTFQLVHFLLHIGKCDWFYHS